MKVTRQVLGDFIVEALREHGGAANLYCVAKHIGTVHKAELENSGPIQFSWHYDMRWSARNLRKVGVLKKAEASRKGVWELA